MIGFVIRPLIPILIAGGVYFMSSLNIHPITPEQKAYKTTEAPKGWTEVDTSTKFSKEELEEMPTISQGQYDNLKIETGNTRVWLSRLTIKDGAKYNNQVTIEHLKNGRWEMFEQYQAR